MTATATAKGEEAKQRGNDAFRGNQYAEAVGHYTEAILADASSHVYYLNRSMAYMKLNKFEDAERDASASIRLQSDNVKAFFRRGSARKQITGRWQEAKEDFEKVLTLDPTNVDAKSEIANIEAELQRQRKQSSREPLDIRKSVEAEVSEGATPSSVKNTNSVEAARRFLEQVGIADKTEHDPGTARKASVAVPDRFPGEEGAHLRQISTRKIIRQPDTIVKAPTFGPTATLGAKRGADSVQLVSPTVPKDSHFLRSSVNPSLSDASLSRISSSTTAAPGKLRLSAYEFYGRLRQFSGEPDATVRYSSLVRLLATLDIDTIPSMLGSLLEPELLTEMLQALLHTEKAYDPLIIDVLSVLPKCERFETAWMFLDKQEKEGAKKLLQRIGQNVEPGLVDEVLSSWKARF